MPNAASRDPSTLHQAELDALVTELVVAGFRPQGGGRHTWVGAIRSSLSRLTAATEMRIEIRDGWPYLHPYLFVGGLVGRKHVNALGNVCLWFEDDSNYDDWLHLGPIMSRIDAWVAEQEAGVPDPAPDAHLYFGVSRGRLLTVDVDGLIEAGQITSSVGASGLLRARLVNDVFKVGDQGNLTAAWFWLPELAAPPALPSPLRQVLTAGQRLTYDRVIRATSRSRSGVLLLVWADAGIINALGAEAKRASVGSLSFEALEVARSDRSVLRLRSGPDAPVLAATTVVVFGVGAIGSEIAMLLARSGVAHLVLVDRERLRPANMTRHAAAGRTIGMPKAHAMAETIRDAMPDVRVESVDALVWDPVAIAARVTGSTLAVDATGNRAYGDLLSRIAGTAGVPLVSAALHRGGRIARIRIQGGNLHPLWARSEANGFPDVPAQPGPTPVPTWETGCGAPVNNARPVSVAAAAALATRLSLDILTGRDNRDREVFEIYEPIEAPPFAEAGIRSFEPTP